ncbi:YhjD/YihY/BrkB family envelope integrity protein [Thalassiella azotivora]
MTASALHGHDLLLVAAGLTFYAGVAATPLLLLSARLASALVGESRIEELAGALGEALPSALGADRLAPDLVLAAAEVSWLVVAVSVLPASLYGEGLRRAYLVVAPPTDGRETLTGWRGRLATLPLLAVAPLLLLAVLAVTPLVAELFSRGVGGGVLGVYVALNVDWLVVSAALVWSFRVVAAREVPWRLALGGGLATGAFVAGFLQGFVLFLSLPIDLGAPFGGATAVGAVTAVGLWVWLLHVVVLTGYVATTQWEGTPGEGTRRGTSPGGTAR